MLKKNLITGIQIISCITAAFGGFFTDFAPPVNNSAFSTGIASIILLLILFLIKSLRGKKTSRKNRKKWLAVGIIGLFMTLISSLIYYYSYNKRTVYFSPHEMHYVKGANESDYTELAKKLKSKYPDINDKELLSKVSLHDLEIEKIWTKKSVDKSKLILLGSYLVFTLFFGVCLFSVIEGGIRRE